MAKRKQPNGATRMPTESSAGRFRDRIVELRRVRCGDIEPHPLNPRLHPGKQLAAVSGLLVEVGKAAPLLAFPADGRGKSGDFSRLMYYDGHGRQIIDQNEVWPVIVTDLTRAEADKMVLSGDATVAMAEYDPVKTRALMDQVETGCAELADMITDLWEDIQADAIADTEPADPTDAEPQTDRAAELQAKWGTAAGQLWLLGNHRLLCGDSTKPEDVARVMEGKKADLLCTDPPYGQAFLSNHYGPNRSSPNPMGRLQNDDKPRPEMLSIWFELIADHGAAYVCTRWAQLEAWRAWIAEREAVRNVIVWKKNNWSAGNLKGAFGFMYELLIFASKDGHELRGDRLPDVWEFDRVAPDEHPTTKPIGLMARAIEKSSDAGDVVADPFLGSGTTLIAAENLGRRCFGLEISSAYCAVILQRYADTFPDQEIRQQD